MQRLLLAAFAIGTMSCTEVTPATTSLAALPIKSACKATSRAPASVGFDVRPGRHQSDARTISVTNSSNAPRSIEVTQVARVEGPCSAEWARQTPITFIDAATQGTPATMTLQPNEHVELQIGDQRVLHTWQCTKLGLAVWMKVDGDEICADAGAWIAESEG